MKVDVYLVKDNDNNIINNFQSLHLAEECAKYTKGNVERIEVNIPNKREVEVTQYKQKTTSPTVQYTGIKSLVDIQNEYMVYVYENVCKKNKTHTARILGITTKTLSSRLLIAKGKNNEQ